jgi:maleylacetoacetate isomerase
MMPVVLMTDLALYNHWRSSSSHRVRIALGVKGLAYRYVAVDLLAKEHTSSDYTARSPTGFVPCLVLNGISYVESVAIVELLEETFPTPALYPADPHARARVRSLVEIVNSGTQPFQNLSVLRFVSPDAEAQRSWVQHFIGRGLASFETAMALHENEGTRARYAYGDAPTAADVFLVPQVVAAKRFGVGMAPFPRVERAFNEAMKLEAFRAAAPDAQPDAPK